MLLKADSATNNEELTKVLYGKVTAECKHSEWLLQQKRKTVNSITKQI